MVRVLIIGSWGFASTNSDKESDLDKIIKSAAKIARIERGKIKIPEIAEESGEFGKELKITDIEEKIKVLKEHEKLIKDKKIQSNSVSLSEAITKKTYINNSGAQITQNSAYEYLSCSAVAKEGEKIQRAGERSWSKTGFKNLDFSIFEKTREKAKRMLNSKPTKKGRFTVVLDPEMTGVLSHEAVGHACEADSVVDGESILKDKIGKRIGNELVNIIDEPQANDFGSYIFDDEGIRSKRVVLVENGILRGFLNSRESAAELKDTPNGHARAESFSEVPTVRMANTYFQRGKSKKEEVFDIRNGIYLKGMKGGSVDIFTGGFMFKAEEAYTIKNGEIGELMQDTTITGNVLETLLKVRKVANDWGTSPGICGKFGQHIPVSDGGPHIQIEDMSIG